MTRSGGLFQTSDLISQKLPKNGEISQKITYTDFHKEAVVALLDITDQTFENEVGKVWMDKV